jgi:uncharacterized protein (TIGR00255 family)
MIYSMTSFARRELKAEWGTATWEIRSVNQRYLETFMRLPEQFRSMEPILRERFRKKLQRGKVECNLRFVANEAAAGKLILNEELASQLMNAAQWVQKQGDTTSIDPMDIMRWPGVVAADEADISAIQADILAEFDLALKDFIASRATEGEAMASVINQRLVSITTEVTKVREHMPSIIQWQKDKITTRFEEAKLELDETRIEQEMIMLAQKVDVAEELDRLDTHIKETSNILKKGGVVGRKLDFMMQEFNREANTLASKSINSEVTKSAVECKVLIEQMREQIQNIE